MTPTGHDHIIYLSDCDQRVLWPRIVELLEREWGTPLACINEDDASPARSLATSSEALEASCQVLFAADEIALGKFERFGFSYDLERPCPILVSLDPLEDVRAQAMIESLNHSASDGIPTEAHRAQLHLKSLVMVTIVSALPAGEDPIVRQICDLVVA